MKVTLNPSVRQPSVCEDVDVMKVLNSFKTNDKHDIQELRKAKKEDQDKRKINLPVVVFGGTFSERRSSKLTDASGLMILDFDCDSESESQRIKEICSEDDYIWSYFRSTRGLGWKALVKIPKVKSDKEYKEYWNAVNDRFPDIDAACKDIARACFYSYDPDLVIKDNAKVWKQKQKDKIQRAAAKLSKTTNYDLINKALNLIRRAKKGERHNTILKAARLCGGWIASGKVDYQEANRLLCQEAYKFNPSDGSINDRTVSDGLDHGMRDPIDEDEFLSKEKLEAKFEKLYYTLADVESDIEDKFENGIPQGYTTGHQNFDDHYRLHMGYTTYIYGAPFSGKSQVWFHLLKRYSVKYKMKHVIFSPETGSASDIMIELMQMYASAHFYNTKGYRMSDSQYEAARDFVDEHFIVIDPKQETMTLDELISSCEIIERVYNVKIHTVTIDPFNDLDAKFGNEPRDIWLEKQLRKTRVAAMMNEWHIGIVTHTRDTPGTRTPEGNVFYDVPTFREIAGGQAWSRRGFMMMAVFRPHREQNEVKGVSVQTNSTIIEIQKYKPKWAGKTGIVHWQYNINEHKYDEFGQKPNDSMDIQLNQDFGDYDAPF